MGRKRHGKEEVHSEPVEGEGDLKTSWAFFATLRALDNFITPDPTRGEEGPKRPGTLSIFAQDGGIKVCLRDRHEGRVAFVYGTNLFKALVKANEQLANGGADWRKDRFAE